MLTAVLGLPLLLLALLAGGPVAAAPASGAAVAAPASLAVPAAGQQVPTADTPVQVHLASVTPGVAGPGVPVTLSGTVRNTSGKAVPRPVVRVRVSDRGLDTRDRVAAWADGSDTGPVGSELARVSLGRSLASGESRSFRLRIKGGALHPGLSFGTLPMTVDVLEGPAPARRAHGKHRRAAAKAADGPVDGTLRTFLPWDNGGDYEPVDISWILPLTLPPDVDLFSTDPQQRAVAWQDAIGPGSNIDALLTGTAGGQVTYLLDQGLVTPQLPPSPTGAPGTSGTPSTATTTSPESGSTSRESGASAPSPTTNPGSVPSGTDASPTARANPPDSRAGPTGPTSSTGPTGSTAGATGPTSSSGSTRPSSSTSPTSPSPSTTSPAQLNAGVARLAADLATRLRDEGSAHPLWVLPYADPDLGAVLPLDAAHPTLQQAMSLPVPTSLGTHTRGGVAWPVSLRLDRKAVKRMRQAYAVRGGLTAAITSRTTVAGQDARTGLAAQKTPSGLPLLAYDDRLSALVNDATSRVDGGTSVQRFLAETMAIYQQRPAVHRSVLVVPPRGFRADPQVLSTLLTQVRDAPWLAPTPAPTLLERARHAKPAAHAPAAPTKRPSTPGGPSYPSPGTSPLSAKRLLHLTFQQIRIDGLASILTDDEDRAAQWTDTEKQLLSTRWRGEVSDWSALADQAQQAITALRKGIHVAPANVNFLADEGSLQVTVVNDLDVDVHDVRLRLVPGSPQLRITAQPGPLHIAAHSRTSVRVHVTALGAGDVPIDAQLTTPNGTSLGSAPRVSVHVQPTGTWIYWVVGIVAGLILALGLYRTLRRGSAHRPAQPGEETTEP